MRSRGRAAPLLELQRQANEDLFALNVRAAPAKKIVQLRGVIAASRIRIEREKKSSTGFQVANEIVEKKFPLVRPPPTAAVAQIEAVEGGREGSDQIKFPPEIG